MRRIRILLFAISMFVFTGCNKAKSNDAELLILGVNNRDIQKIEIIHGNIIIYPDFKQKGNLALIEGLNTVLDNTGDSIETLDETLDIALADAEAYAQNNADNYYVYITFSDNQTLSLKNDSNEEYENCDGALIDISNMKLNWSKDGKFVETMGYTNNLTSVEKEYSIFLNTLEETFDDLKIEYEK